MKRTSPTINDQRQLALFADLPTPSEDELIRRFYARLRKLGITLSYDIDAERPDINAYRKRLGVPSWFAVTARRFSARIVRDLMRVQHGIEPEIERQDLDGGAELLRLPAPHDASLDPPVAKPFKARRPDRGGAA